MEKYWRQIIGVLIGMWIVVFATFVYISYHDATQIKALRADNIALKQTIEQLAESQNKLEQVHPQLVDWVYKHSDVSRAMAKTIVVSTVSQTSCPLFMLALIKTESNFNPTAISGKGAMGLGQVMPYHEKTLKEAGIITEMRDIFDIQTGVRATNFMWDLKMTQAEGNIDRALELYLGTHRESYVNRILKDYFYLNYLCKKALLQEEPEPESAVEVIESAIGAATMYTVQAGDCLSSIIRAHYGSATEKRIRAIGEYNELQNINFLEIGQTIILPLQTG